MWAVSRLSVLMRLYGQSESECSRVPWGYSFPASCGAHPYVYPVLFESENFNLLEYRPEVDRNRNAKYNPTPVVNG
jgi:hypothetical protein